MQAGFCPDDVNSIIKESVDAVLANQQYSEVKVRLTVPHSTVCLDGP
jgi:hypothetical protein